MQFRIFVVAVVCMVIAVDVAVVAIAINIIASVALCVVVVVVVEGSEFCTAKTKQTSIVRNRKEANLKAQTFLFSTAFRFS